MTLYAHNVHTLSWLVSIESQMEFLLVNAWIKNLTFFLFVSPSLSLSLSYSLLCILHFIHSSLSLAFIMKIMYLIIHTNSSFVPNNIELWLILKLKKKLPFPKWCKQMSQWEFVEWKIDSSLFLDIICYL